MILLLTGSFRDVDEKRVWNWWEPGPGQASPGASSEQMEAILFELDAMRSDMGELNERVDFVERVLARAKDREALPGH
jgi:polyhydroxyalkanoate synthesis regulator phasin